MRRALAIRRSRSAFSSLYGAFAVVLVSTVVVGLVLAGAHRPPRAPDLDGRLADLYLDTLLKSEVAKGVSLSEALSGSCFEASCQAFSWNATSLAGATDALAAPLAHALERRYAVEVAQDGVTVFRVGDLPERAPGTASRADVYHPIGGAFLAVTAVLSAP